MDDLDAEFDASMAGLASAGLPDDTPAGDYSHDALALEWGVSLAGTARHVDLWSQWLLWTGTHWQRDQTRRAWTLAREFIRPLAAGLPEKMATKLRSAETVAAVISLARSNREIAAAVDVWDRDPYLLGTPGGTVDLRTGLVREPRPGDMITKLTAVAPAAPGTPAPIWTAFLARIFRHDPELVPCVQRALGYGLTGETKEHVFFFAFGQGGNGKGVLLNTASRTLGDYSAVAPNDLLLVTHGDRHPCDMALLRGARLVTAQELGAGRQWDEPKLKSITGGDDITARFMRQDFFTYEPQFTLFVAGNHKPSFKGVDEAIRRRVLLLPFLQNLAPEERDPALPEKLKVEWPAILRWMIDGCLAWQRQGLGPPTSVRAATDDYMTAEDTLGQWLDERCMVSPKLDWTSLATLYGCWKTWCEARGQNPGTFTALSKRLDERGFRREKKTIGAGFWGIGLAPPPQNDGNDGNPFIDRNDRFQARAHVDAPYGTNRHFRHSPEGGTPPTDPWEDL